MFCKNCGKEMKDGSAFCSECGTKNEQGTTEVNTQIDATAFQSAMSNSSGTAVAVKKKSKGKFIIIGVFVLLIIIVIACAVGGSSDVIESSSETGASFNCTIDDVIDRYNSNIDEHLINDANLSDEEYNSVKNQFKMNKSNFEQQEEHKYFASSNNDSYGITVFTDENNYVYGVEFVVQNDVILDRSLSDQVFLLIRGLYNSVEPSKSYDEIEDIVTVASKDGVLQKDNVKHVVTYETTTTRFASIALFNE